MGSQRQLHKTTKQLALLDNDTNKRSSRSNAIFICCCVFMIIPILNLIFGWIALKRSYLKNDISCKKKRITCSVVFFIGIAEIIVGVVLTILLLIDNKLGVTFNHKEQISLIINFSVFAVCCIGSAVFLWKLKLAGNGYKLLFVMYTIFWIPLMLLRENTGTFQGAINADWRWIALGAYGAIGIIVRPIADIMNWGTRSRKSFIYLALAMQVATYIPVVIVPCTATSIIQSIGVGFGASCIGTYQLMFNEQYGKAKTFLTVSVLSIPPLLADFISSPITNICRTLSIVGYDGDNNPIFGADHLKWMWIVGLVLVLVAIILAIIMREDRTKLFKDNKNKTEIHGKNLIWYFVLLLLLGSLIGFIKFATSGTATVGHIEALEKLAEWPDSSFIYVGYLSVIFSVGQLIGGLLVGLVLVRYMNKLAIFGIGAGLWAIYAVGSMFVLNPYVYLPIHFINGLAFGILYNFVLAFALGLCFKTKWITPMGIYQAVLSIGIMFASSFASWLKGQMDPTSTPSDYQHQVLFLIYGVVLGMIVISFFIYFAMYKLEKRYYKDHPDKVPKKSATKVEFKKTPQKPKEKPQKQINVKANKIILNPNYWYNFNLIQ